MVTVVAPEVRRRHDKIVNLKMPKQDHILAFCNQVNDPIFSDEIVVSKMSIPARKTIGLALKIKPPNIKRHLFTKDERRDWFLNPTITKAILFHLVFTKEGEDDTDIISIP